MIENLVEPLLNRAKSARAGKPARTLMVKQEAWGSGKTIGSPVSTPKSCLMLKALSFLSNQGNPIIHSSLLFEINDAVFGNLFRLDEVYKKPGWAVPMFPSARNDIVEKDLSLQSIVRFERLDCEVVFPNPFRFPVLDDGADHFMDYRKLGATFEPKFSHPAGAEFALQTGLDGFAHENVSAQHFVEAFEARSKIDGISDQREIHVSDATDISRDNLVEMESDACP